MKNSSLTWAESLPRKIGRAEFIKHLKGHKLSARQRLNAACCRCSSGYDTGEGCTVTECPLQPLNPYVLKQNRADLSHHRPITDNGNGRTRGNDSKSEMENIRGRKNG